MRFIFFIVFFTHQASAHFTELELNNWRNCRTQYYQQREKNRHSIRELKNEFRNLMGVSFSVLKRDTRPCSPAGFVVSTLMPPAGVIFLASCDAIVQQDSNGFMEHWPSRAQEIVREIKNRNQADWEISVLRKMLFFNSTDNTIEDPQGQTMEADYGFKTLIGLLQKRGRAGIFSENDVKEAVLALLARGEACQNEDLMNSDQVVQYVETYLKSPILWRVRPDELNSSFQLN
jgi:hypothetical protein